MVTTDLWVFVLLALEVAQVRGSVRLTDLGIGELCAPDRNLEVGPRIVKLRCYGTLKLSR